MTTTTTRPKPIRLQDPDGRLTPKAKRLLERALSNMVRYPETVDMTIFYDHDHFTNKHKRRLPKPFCGTIACLAGHIILAAKQEPQLGAEDRQAANLIGLNPDPAWELFRTHDLDGNQYPRASRAQARAVVLNVQNWLHGARPRRPRPSIIP